MNEKCKQCKLYKTHCPLGYMGNPECDFCKRWIKKEDEKDTERHVDDI